MSDAHQMLTDHNSPARSTRPARTYTQMPRFQRVKVSVLGRYMLADRREFPCQVLDMSPGGMAIIGPVSGKAGERVVAYIDHVGRLEGTITAAKEIYVAEDAEVEATLMAATVIVAGKVTGEVRCTTRFEMLPSGRVDGNIQAPSLVVHEGASITGQFRMGAPEANAESKLSTVMGRRPARGTA